MSMRIFFHHTKNRGIVNSEFYKMLADYKNLDNTKIDLHLGKTTEKNINKNLESIRKSHGIVLVRDSYCDLSQFYLAYAYCQVPNLPVFYAVENRDIFKVNNKIIETTKKNTDFHHYDKSFNLEKNLNYWLRKLNQIHFPENNRQFY